MFVQSVCGSSLDLQRDMVNGKVHWSLVLRQKVKGKAIPLQAWTGPEGSRRLRLPDLKTIGT